MKELAGYLGMQNLVMITVRQLTQESFSTLVRSPAGAYGREKERAYMQVSQKKGLIGYFPVPLLISQWLSLLNSPLPTSPVTSLLYVCPIEACTSPLTSPFRQNNPLSGNLDPILAAQGISWFKRKAVTVGTVHTHLKTYTDDAGVEHLDVQQLLANVAGNSEDRKLHWEETKSNDPVYGAVISKARRVKPDELDISFLKEGWSDDTKEHGVVEIHVRSDTAKSWTENQTWGVKVVNGERRYVRHVKFTGPKGEDVQIEMVYDYSAYDLRLTYGIILNADSFCFQSELSRHGSQCGNCQCRCNKRNPGPHKPFHTHPLCLRKLFCLAKNCKARKIWMRRVISFGEGAGTQTEHI